MVFVLFCFVLFLFWYTCIAVSSEVTEVQSNARNDTTLVIFWERPVNPNGIIVNYSISINNLADGHLLGQEITVNTSFTQTNLGTRLMSSYPCHWIVDFMSNSKVLPTRVFSVAPGIPYNVSIAAVNGAGIGQVTSFVNFSQELSTSLYPTCMPKTPPGLIHLQNQALLLWV